MPLILLSFLAGIITIAAPCVLPLLPIIIGGSIAEGEQKSRVDSLRPLIIAASLAVSVVVFTLLIKATTALLGVPQEVWQWLSASIIILLGVNYLRPELWEKVSVKFGLGQKTNSKLGKAHQKGGWGGAVLTGAALGPVFNSCSPTYALIVATVIPVSFIEGLTYLIAYALGMSLALLGISYLGSGFLARFKNISNPKGNFKKGMGILFILVGLAVAFGFDKKAQAYVLEKGWYDPISGLEERLR